MADLKTEIRQLIPGTADYKRLRKSRNYAEFVLDQWALGETVYSQLSDRIDENRSFYLGKQTQQFNSTTVEGNLRITANVGAAILDLIMFILSNNPPTVQVIPESASKLDQVESAATEDLVDKAFADAEFKRKFRDSAKMFIAFAGFVWWYPFWNKDREFGRERNKFDFTLLNPLMTRVNYASTDYDKIQNFITYKRMTQDAIYKRYDKFEAVPDSENPFISRTVTGLGVDDGKTSVFNFYDSKNVVTVIDGRVAENREHGFDFPPLIQTNNIGVINDIHGHDDLERWKPLAQELNMLISASSEIARDLAWPPLLEYNKALGGRKVSKWRGQKIPVRRTERGEAIEYLLNKAQIAPLLEQIKVLLDLLHFVSLMPKAAAGIFDSSVTSGFQAKLAMQPATLAGDNKKIDFDSSVKKLARMALHLIEVKDAEAMKIELPNGRTAKLVDLKHARMEVIWPDNLPIDIAREVQNLILGIQNSLTSVTQAIDRYNALMGLGSPEDTQEYLQQEANNADLAPERALKVAQVKQALAQVQEAVANISGKVKGGLPPQLSEARESANPTNLARGAGGRLPEERRPVPATAREAVTPESTGGQVLPEV